jgi:hypothetical protein
MLSSLLCKTYRLRRWYLLGRPRDILQGALAFPGGISERRAREWRFWGKKVAREVGVENFFWEKGVAREDEKEFLGDVSMEGGRA